MEENRSVTRLRQQRDTAAAMWHSGSSVTRNQLCDNLAAAEVAFQGTEEGGQGGRAQVDWGWGVVGGMVMIGGQRRWGNGGVRPRQQWQRAAKIRQIEGFGLLFFNLKSKNCDLNPVAKCLLKPFFIIATTYVTKKMISKYLLKSECIATGNPVAKKKTLGTGINYQC